MFGISNWLLVFSIGVAWLGYAAFRLVQVRRFYKNLPMPPGHSFLFGHLKLMGEVAAKFPPNVHPQYYFTYLSQRYALPGAWYIDLWPVAPPQLVITDPDAAMQVLTVTPTLKHDEVNRFMTPIIGSDTIVAVNGEAWKAAHRTLGSGFAPSYFKPMLGMVAAHVLMFHGKLRELAAAGEAFPLEEVTARAVFDVISEIVFGFSLDAQKAGSPLLDDIRRSVEFLNDLISSWNPVTKAIGFVRMYFLRRRNSAAIEKALLERYEVMKDEKALPSRREAKSIMDRIVADHIQSGNTRRPDGPFLESVVKNLLALLLGGHGTTTDTFTLMMMLLSLHPEAMRRMREEHDAVFPAGLDETAEILRSQPGRTNELEYTTAVIKETLRMFPVGFSVRKAPEGVTFLNWDGKRLPLEGQMLSLCQFTSQFDPAIWKDPKKFRPERFLGEEGASLHRFAWRPFERGPRACMGQDLAMDEMRVMLLLTARWFDFETIPASPSKEPRVMFTDLDLKVGDLAFQELRMEAAPRAGLRMRVKLAER